MTPHIRWLVGWSVGWKGGKHTTMLIIAPDFFFARNDFYRLICWFVRYNRLLARSPYMWQSHLEHGFAMSFWLDIFWVLQILIFHRHLFFFQSIRWCFCVFAPDFVVELIFTDFNFEPLALDLSISNSFLRRSILAGLKAGFSPSLSPTFIQSIADRIFQTCSAPNWRQPTIINVRPQKTTFSVRPIVRHNS